MASEERRDERGGIGGWLRSKWMALAAGAAGAGLGVTYALTIGCATGGCPITSSPWLSGGMGFLLGYTLVNDFVLSRKPEPTPIPAMGEEAEPGESEALR